MQHPFVDRLARGPILCDGAMGTMLYARGIPFTRCFDELNLSDPGVVLDIHRAYLQAGAEIIETNTFGGNRFRLESHGLQDQARAINLRGAKLAREAREIEGVSAFVAGSIGPAGRSLAPVGSLTPQQAYAAFREQVEALLEGGVDLFILETFSDLREITQAVQAVQDACDVPIVAQMSFNDDGETPAGNTPEDVTRVMEDMQVAAVGANCCLGPAVTLSVLQRMHSAARGRLSVQPNAGYPRYLEGRFLYYTTPAYFADYAQQFIDAGASVVGSCCGTTPQHTAAMARVLHAHTPQPKAPPRPVSQPLPLAEKQVAEEGAATPSTLRDKLQAGRFVVSVELDPPKGLNPSKALQGAAMLKEYGVDCINIGDSPMARVRMSCIGLAYLIQNRVGLETVIHFTTRDRNLMGLQSDLLGAHAVGIRNILALTGDPPRLGDYPNAKAVYDLDSIGLITVLRQMNDGQDWAGNAIGSGASYFIGCALDMQRCLNEPQEMERFRRKIAAGADFIMSQPIYDITVLEEFLARYGALERPHLLGIMPLQSHRHAEFLHNEVPGITLPDWVRERMRLAGEHGLQEGLAMAQELLAAAQQHVQGTYLMPSFGRYELVGELVKVLSRRDE